MKLSLIKFIFCFVLFLSLEINAANLSATYKIITKGVKIGELSWDLYKNEDTYKFELYLKSKGILSSLFKFEGEYSSVGKIKNGSFVSINYSQKWTTRKKHREIKINFNENKIVNILQTPKEKERARVNIFLIKDYSDPLASFLNLLSGKKESDTIDGRRVYTLSLDGGRQNSSKLSYYVRNYDNIWADHKRNDLKKILIEKNNQSLLPKNIYIDFKGQLFKVIKN